MVTTGVLSGRFHRAQWRNGQDAAYAAEAAAGVAFGIVFDGCGGGLRDERGRHPSRNEVAAHLSGAFVSQWLVANLQPDSNLPALCGALEIALVGFLRRLTAAIPFVDDAARVRFVGTHLLATCLGFILTPEQALFFSAGDGILASNLETWVLDEDNQPAYLGYRALDGAPLTAFHLRSLPREELRWLAVATDGWDPELVAEAVSAESIVALQRRINVWGQAAPHFGDDGAIAIWRDSE